MGLKSIERPYSSRAQRTWGNDVGLFDGGEDVYRTEAIKVLETLRELKRH